MQLDVNGFIYSLSYALDCVEAEFVGVQADHAKWVAYISALIGKRLGLNRDALIDLAACAALHDNALTQFMSRETIEVKADPNGVHCSLGEENIKAFPFRGDTTGFILYHHENVDGSGPFNKRFDQIPLQAHIIHIADMLDAACAFHDISYQTYDRVCAYLKEQRGVMFDSALIDAFHEVMPKEKYMSLFGKNIDELLTEELPHDTREYPFEQIKAMMDVFGKIVDYKSPFTRNHSDQIGRKLIIMSRVLGYDEEKSQRLYVAGVLHDIGKMAIMNDVLEKPDRLTTDEFAHMQNHAWYTNVILNKIKGFEDIAEWAGLHHEKLDGSGYPFGKKAQELSEPTRLMSCIDIYQALREDRPYKKGMDHIKSMEIMHSMAEQGLIDSYLTRLIDEQFGFSGKENEEPADKKFCLMT